ncbi:MAG: hypothetical protein ACREBU_02350 [Nitrososphaera sp.]
MAEDKDKDVAVTFEEIEFPDDFDENERKSAFEWMTKNCKKLGLTRRADSDSVRTMNQSGADAKKDQGLSMDGLLTLLSLPEEKRMSLVALLGPDQTKVKPNLDKVKVPKEKLNEKQNTFRRWI